jgi:SMI1 / KNR4 family (SUKH-1)
MRDLHELNLNEGGRPVTRRAPTAKEITAFEAEHGVSLPGAYLRLLRHANGGHPELDSFLPVDAADAADRWQVNSFYFLDADTEHPESLWRVTRRWRPVLGPHRIPVAQDGGGNQVYLDFTTDPPAVRLCVHDAGFSSRLVAPTFEEFLDLLQDDPDMI